MAVPARNRHRFSSCGRQPRWPILPRPISSPRLPHPTRSAMTAPTDSGYRQSHQGCGTEYHSQFSDNPRRRMMWQIEQAMLEDVLESTRQQSPVGINYLDFACGTGRVLGFVSEHTNTATGVDVSDSMLEVAATSAPGAELISADIT
ncbi:MAG TPA: hypothetical protein DCE43_04495, partial [Planctomycetaceae bacterium]|nr:hypothetical protein [Planctomycetaceae bacterium]